MGTEHARKAVVVNTDWRVSHLLAQFHEPLSMMHLCPEASLGQSKGLLFLVSEWLKTRSTDYLY
jgi:hypothetical protein